MKIDKNNIVELGLKIIKANYCYDKKINSKFQVA
jgi:hypothetical protein